MTGNAKMVQPGYGRREDPANAQCGYSSREASEAQLELRATLMRVEQLERENTQLKFENSKLRVSLTDALLRSASKS